MPRQQGLSIRVMFHSLWTNQNRLYPTPSMSVVRLPPALPLPVTPKPPLPAPSMGVPMDVDATRKARSLSPQGCYQCGDTNHPVRDCSHCMDVRQLTSEQWEQLFEDLLALKDVVLVEQSCPPEEEEDFA